MACRGKYPNKGSGFLIRTPILIGRRSTSHSTGDGFCQIDLLRFHIWPTAESWALPVLMKKCGQYWRIIGIVQCTHIDDKLEIYIVGHFFQKGLNTQLIWSMLVEADYSFLNVRV